jgi:hypothetical protein
MEIVAVLIGAVIVYFFATATPGSSAPAASTSPATVPAQTVTTPDYPGNSAPIQLLETGAPVGGSPSGPTPAAPTLPTSAPNPGLAVGGPAGVVQSVANTNPPVPGPVVGHVYPPASGVIGRPMPVVKTFAAPGV